MSHLLVSDPRIDHILDVCQTGGVHLTREGFLSEMEKMKANTWAEDNRVTIDSMLTGMACQRFILWRFNDKGIVLTARGVRVLKTLREETA